METTQVVSREIAENDLNRFLDYKKIKPQQKNNLENDINILVDSIMSGSLIVNEDCSLTYKLDFPLENDKGEVTVEKLAFKPRIRASEIDEALKGVNTKIPTEFIRAYASAITGKAKSVLAKLDTNDNKIVMSIVNFFI